MSEILFIIDRLVGFNEGNSSMGRKSDPNKRQHIITAAASVFAKRGYAGTRIVEIADAAGIGKGTVYEYFRSKEDLFYAVFVSMMQEPIAELQAIPDITQIPISKRMEKVADVIIQSWLPRLDQYSLVMEFWSAATTLSSRERFKVVFRQIYADMRNLAAHLLQQGVASGNFDSRTECDKVAMAMVGTLDFFLLQAWLDPAFDAGDAYRAFLKVMLRGLQSQNGEVQR